jgi:hypothetical protein
MFCPACSKEIPEQSTFCLYCGAAIQGAQATLTGLPHQPPADVSIVAGGFLGAVKPMPGKTGQYSRAGFYLRLALSDEHGSQTTADGMAVARIRIWQVVPGATEPVSILRTQVTFAVKGSLFALDHTTGRLFFQYDHPVKIGRLRLQGVETRARIELELVPAGGKQELHKAVELTLDPAEV